MKYILIFVPLVGAIIGFILKTVAGDQPVSDR